MRRFITYHWVWMVMTLFITLSLPRPPAEAADLTLEVQFTVPLVGPETVMISSQDMLYPEGGVELEAQSTGTVIQIPGLDPDVYMFLFEGSSGEILGAEFTLFEDGTVVFQPSPYLQQDGNIIILEP